jgi:peroxiredoxin (alkyl hydroperoxide reductase subunit C)
MSIQVGDAMPVGKFAHMTAEGPAEITTDELFSGKKVVLFSVPGAFTPTCSQAHLPSFVVKLDELKAKGVDTVACMAVNDVFVMGAWGQHQNAEHILMLADGSGEYARALGLELDLTDKGLGVRGDRFALIVDNGKVTHLAQEQPGQYAVSSAEAILQVL